MNLTSGQNIALTAPVVQIHLSSANQNPDLTIDQSIFLLGANGKVGKDEDLVFFNNPQRTDVGVLHNPNTGITEIELNKLPASIDNNIRI